MKRGERAQWRKIAHAIDKIIDSKNHAQEYVAKQELKQEINVMQELMKK